MNFAFYGFPFIRRHGVLDLGRFVVNELAGFIDVLVV